MVFFDEEDYPASTSTRNISLLWDKIFDLPAYGSRLESYITLPDGSYSKPFDPQNLLTPILASLQFLINTLDSQSYRHAHNLERLELDMRFVDSQYESIKCPSLVVLVLLYRFVVYHPKQISQSIPKSKEHALEQLRLIRSGMDSLLNNDQFTTKYPDMSAKWEWLSDSFLITFGKLMDALEKHAIPAEFGSKYGDDCSIEFNAAAWILDIDYRIYGLDEWVFRGWEEGLRKEICYLSANEYENQRRAQLIQIQSIKPTIFFIPSVQRECEKPVKTNISNFDFSLYEPYEEDLEELVQNLPPSK